LMNTDLGRVRSVGCQQRNAQHCHPYPADHWRASSGQPLTKWPSSFVARDSPQFRRGSCPSPARTTCSAVPPPRGSPPRYRWLGMSAPRLLLPQQRTLLRTAAMQNRMRLRSTAPLPEPANSLTSIHPLRTSGPERLTQYNLQDFACTRERHWLIADRHAARAFVTGDQGVAMRDHLLWRHARACSRNDNCMNGFTPLFVRDPHYG